MDALNVIDVYIGARIRACRHRRRISPVTVARQLGVSIEKVQDFEAGRVRVEVAQLYVVARFLRVPISYFFGTEEGGVQGNDEHAEAAANSNEQSEFGRDRGK